MRSVFVMYLLIICVGLAYFLTTGLVHA